MAQTRRKRQTKHRGNAAGVVESRGRTGRKPTAAEKSGDPVARAREKEKLLDKRDRPPTWSARVHQGDGARRSCCCSPSSSCLHQSTGAIGLFPIVLVFYTVVSYFTDKWMYDRRQRKKLGQGGGGKAASR